MALVKEAVLAVMLLLAAGAAFAGSEEDARRYMVRGMAAVEMAKSDEELSGAAVEFKRATELAPGMAAAWYNLGAVQVKLGELKEAIASYQRYLALAPDAADARKIEDEIIKLEYRMEKAAQFSARGGVWIDDAGTFYSVAAEKTRIVVQGTRGRSRSDIDYSDVMIFNFGSLGNLGVETITIKLDAKGSRLVGTWEVPSGKIYPTDACTLPPEKGGVEGELDGTTGRMTLRLMRAKYKVVQVEPPLGSRTCQEVSVLETRPVEMVFHGPLPEGGVRYAGLNGDGIFTIFKVDKGSNEELEGLEEGDEILSIDEVPVQGMGTVPEKIQRLRGEVGTTIKLLVKRPGGLFSSEKTLTVLHKRSLVK